MISGVFIFIMGEKMEKKNQINKEVIQGKRLVYNIFISSKG